MFYSPETKGFYTEGSPLIPDGAIEVSDEDYAALFAGQSIGQVIVPGEGGYPVLFDPRPVVTLDSVKVELKSQIDAGAERERLKYITPGAGQAMTYSQKADEAARFLANGNTGSSAYPMLEAEVGITAPTLAEVATVVSTAFSQWQIIGAAIEGVRLGGKKAVDDATTIAAAEAAFAGVGWPQAS